MAFTTQQYSAEGYDRDSPERIFSEHGISWEINHAEDTLMLRFKTIRRRLDRGAFMQMRSDPKMAHYVAQQMRSEWEAYQKKATIDMTPPLYPWQPTPDKPCGDTVKIRKPETFGKPSPGANPLLLLLEDV